MLRAWCNSVDLLSDARCIQLLQEGVEFVCMYCMNNQEPGHFTMY